MAWNISYDIYCWMAINHFNRLYFVDPNPGFIVVFSANSHFHPIKFRQYSQIYNWDCDFIFLWRLWLWRYFNLWILLHTRITDLQFIWSCICFYVCIWFSITCIFKFFPTQDVLDKVMHDISLSNILIR